MRTGYIITNKYLKRIGKRESRECECGGREQSVEHVLEECKFTEESREESERKGFKGRIKLLFSKEGAEHGVKIWKEFIRQKKEATSERKEEDKDDTYRFGGIDRDNGEE